jgi:hypothetical protein
MVIWYVGRVLFRVEAASALSGDLCVLGGKSFSSFFPHHAASICRNSFKLRTYKKPPPHPPWNQHIHISSKTNGL